MGAGCSTTRFGDIHYRVLGWHTVEAPLAPRDQLEFIIDKLGHVYDHYKERYTIEKARAVLSETQQNDRNQALVHLYTARRYEQAMRSISQFQIRFIQIKIDLQTTRDMVESIGVLEKTSAVVAEQLRSLTENDRLATTLATLSAQMERIQGIDTLTTAASDQMLEAADIKTDATELEKWCAAQQQQQQTTTTPLPAPSSSAATTPMDTVLKLFNTLTTKAFSSEESGSNNVLYL